MTCSAPNQNKNHQQQVDQPVASRISMSAQDFMLRNFAQVRIAEVQAGISLNAPSDKEARADVFGCPGDQVDPWLSKQDIMDLHMAEQDTNFSLVVRSCL